jgi:hypothetical protein
VIENPVKPPFYRVQKNIYKEISFKSGNFISLKNGYGDIEIKGWDLEKVEIFATISSRPIYRRRAYLYGFYGNLPKIKVDKFEEFLKIETEYKEIPEDEFLIDYNLNVPYFVIIKEVNVIEGDIFISDISGEVNLELINGDIRIENFSGSLNISVDEGSVKSSLRDLREEDEIKITNKNGNIIVFLEPDANFSIDAKAPNGTIKCEFAEKEGKFERELKGKIGKGGAVLSLFSPNGNIEIRKL